MTAEELKTDFTGQKHKKCDEFLGKSIPGLYECRICGILSDSPKHPPAKGIKDTRTEEYKEYLED